MKAFVLRSAPTLIYGEGEVNNLAGYLREEGATKVLVSYDIGVYKAGLVTPVLEGLGDLPYVTFGDIVPESPDTAVQALRDFAKDKGVDAYVSIGGGSTTDTTRAALILSKTTGNVNDYFRKEPEITTREHVFVCIPTTAGTGAEMSAGGPIMDTVNHIKAALRLPPKQPNIVILDPTMTRSLPPFVTYTCAMDAMAHSIEAMTGNMRNAMTDMICGQAVEYIWKNLPIAMEHPDDMDARGKLLLASNMAIGCQNLRHLGHASCQPVGARIHLAHGYSCATVLPGMVARLANVPSMKESWEQVARRMGIEAENPGEAIARTLQDANDRYEIKTLEKAGYNWEEVIACTDEILGDGRLLPNCPIEVTREDVEAVLHGMFYGI